MSDTQMATLGTYLMGHFGNPAGTVTAAQVGKLRAGSAPSSLLIVLAQVGVGVAVLVLIAIIFLLIRWWRRPPAMQAAGSQAL
jgi:hypothetical protein